jgi:predicted molibdopterin-dependent oxidoreductase YjgC
MQSRLEAADDRRRVPFHLNGRPAEGLQGQTLAAALLAGGCRVWRLTERRGEPRGLFCGMGVCFDCLVRVAGRGLVRACQTPLAEGMWVETPCDPSQPAEVVR